MQKISPCLWFDTAAEEAADFYVSVFKNSRILNTSYYGEAGPREADMVLTVTFELDGHEFTALNGGPEFTFDEAISFQIGCDTQDEVDYFWDTLSEGGEPGQCGWLKDKFGVSWQVVPTIIEQVMADPARAQKAMAMILKMTKPDVAALQRAADQA